VFADKDSEENFANSLKLVMDSQDTMYVLENLKPQSFGQPDTFIERVGFDWNSFEFSVNTNQILF